MSIPSTMPVPQFVGDGRITFGEKPVPAPGPGQLLIIESFETGKRVGLA